MNHPPCTRILDGIERDVAHVKIFIASMRGAANHPPCTRILDGIERDIAHVKIFMASMRGAANASALCNASSQLSAFFLGMLQAGGITTQTYVDVSNELLDVVKHLYSNIPGREDEKV